MMFMKIEMIGFVNEGVIGKMKKIGLQESDILNTLSSEAYVNQRILSEKSGHSLGIVNRSIKNLVNLKYIDDNMRLTKKARILFSQKKTHRAIILAAGYGMRMVPINLNVPKAFLEVKGEALIERIINQLHAVGVKDIVIVVGFMKEKFEYLIDKYGVELVVNTEYSNKNNLHSLALVVDKIGNSYIAPSDIWCKDNPFNTHEMYSWYMVSDELSEESEVSVNRSRELVRLSQRNYGNNMIGIAYIDELDAPDLRKKIIYLDGMGIYDGDFWESSLYEKRKMTIPARVVSSSEIFEINTYEELRELDKESNHLKSEAMDIIAKKFCVDNKDIKDINVLKKGMTNRSFLFSVKGQKYIMRVPGEGTNKLINRYQEALVFKTISGKGLCDDPVYIDPNNGFKITKFIEGVRPCDSDNPDDIKRCMDKLREFHEMKLNVPHVFDLFGEIDFYEEMWGIENSVYRDYKETKKKVWSLKDFIDSLDKEWCLTHIDAVPDNFIFYQTNEGERVQLTDWEYAGMQDPHVDVAMFCLYSLYDKRQIDKLIDIYFENRCDRLTRAKIYAYISICGLLWSNWCEFKRNLGVDFGEYSLKQYRYAKEFYNNTIDLLKEE